MGGPDRITIDAPAFTASGNFLRLEGRVVCELMADWMAGAWKKDLQPLSGKLKLMPLPAWLHAWNGFFNGISIFIEIFGKAIAPKDVLTASRGEMVEGIVVAQLKSTALRIGDFVDRPNDPIVVAFFAVDGKLSIRYVLLKEYRTAFSAGVDEPDLSVVVLGESPLATV